MHTSALVQRFSFVVFFLTLVSATALAQPVPNAGQVAAGGEFGIFLPADDQLDPGLVAGGLIEFYATPRVGIRGTVTAIRNGYNNRDDDDERQLRFGADVIYNWEYGVVHPFLGAGIAMHWLRFYDDGENVGENDTEFGMQVLGGAEFFMNRDWAVKAEARYQWVPDRPHVDPDGLALTIGLKAYF